MVKFWIRAFLVSVIVSGLFAILASSLSYDDVSSVRARGLASMMEILGAAFLEPLGLPLATATIFVAMMAIMGFFALGKQPPEKERENYIGAEATGAKPQIPAPAASFGKRTERASEDPPNGDPAHAMAILQTRGFDWYFAHYGFEGNWRKAHAGMLAMGETEKASVLMEAGTVYDAFIKDVFVPSGGEPSADDERSYLDKTRLLDKRYKSIGAE